MKMISQMFFWIFSKKKTNASKQTNFENYILLFLLFCCCWLFSFLPSFSLTLTSKCFEHFYVHTAFFIESLFEKKFDISIFPQFFEEVSKKVPHNHLHPWLVELSISVLICRTQFIYKNDALGHGNFNSKMATSFQITSLGQPGQGSEICLQNTFWHMAVLPLMVQKNYDNQCVEYQQPIILYHQHFFVHQLFFYLQAKM